MSWADVEDAMQKAVVLASRLPSTQVVWSYQNINEPTLPHIVIKFGGATVIGIDRIATSEDLNRPNGQEMKQEIRGVREVPFELQAFTTATTGAAAARHVLELIRTRLRLPSIRYGLRKVGLSPFDPGPVDYVPDIPAARFRGRAVCTIRCYVPVMDCEEYVGYIARVVGTVVFSGSVGGTGTRSFDTG